MKLAEALAVGQPRDGDWRAAFAVYDDALLLFTWFRVPYDFLAAQRRIRRAAHPDVLAARLRVGIKVVSRRPMELLGNCTNVGKIRRGGSQKIAGCMKGGS